MTRNELIIKLADAINSCSAENGSDTPDFILAQLLADVLGAFNAAVRMRETWYGRERLPRAALQEPPPTQVANIPRCWRCGRALRPQLMGTLVCDSCGTTHAPHWPVKDGAAPATAAPAGEPKERVCRWTLKPVDSFRRDGTAACTLVCWPRGGAMTFCPDCGGKIITEAT